MRRRLLLAALAAAALAGTACGSGPPSPADALPAAAAPAASHGAGAAAPSPASPADLPPADAPPLAPEGADERADGGFAGAEEPGSHPGDEDEPSVEHEPVRAAATAERVVEVTVDGFRRPVLVVRPPVRRRRTPLVVVLHGRGGTGAEMRDLGLEPWAARAGAFLAYPDGLGGSWNDDRPGLVPPVVADDVAFLQALVDRVAVEERTSPGKVALVGFSNGALMTSRFACERSEALAAAVLVGAAGPDGLGERCRPHRGVPMLLVSGTADEIVPYDGGAVAGPNRGFVAPAAEAVAVWRRAAGCTHVDTTSMPGAVERLQGVGCNEGLELRHDRLLGGGHVWARPGYDTTAEVVAFLGRNFARRPGGARLAAEDAASVPSSG